ncbi:ester cyclase [Eleftheria terrae]|uniref:ester cyclase n=1 Tax=Eleftheria terrae TaxID=1597781 RepID=UPI00263B7899|nr:ester cyclase [Eleftheria terrae]WKB55692.1 ester cyclase [Eleftheria terrae]
MIRPLHRSRTLPLWAALLLAAVQTARAAPGDELPQPRARLVDASLQAPQLERMTLAARRYYAFWNTGDPALARAALAPDFIDRTLPAGRPQGLEGALFASRQIRAAVPDLRAEVEEMLVVGDRVIARLRFSGHFTGVFGDGPQAGRGRGEAIDFIATDIYRISEDRIAENWHLEDRLTLLQ